MKRNRSENYKFKLILGRDIELREEKNKQITNQYIAPDTSEERVVFKSSLAIKLPKIKNDISRSKSKRELVANGLLVRRQRKAHFGTLEDIDQPVKSIFLNPKFESRRIFRIKNTVDGIGKSSNQAHPNNWVDSMKHMKSHRFQSIERLALQDKGEDKFIDDLKDRLSKKKHPVAKKYTELRRDKEKNISMLVQYIEEKLTDLSVNDASKEIESFIKNKYDLDPSNQSSAKKEKTGLESASKHITTDKITEILEVNEISKYEFSSDNLERTTEEKIVEDYVKDRFPNVPSHKFINEYKFYRCERNEVGSFVERSLVIFLPHGVELNLTDFNDFYKTYRKMEIHEAYPEFIQSMASSHFNITGYSGELTQFSRSRSGSEDNPNSNLRRFFKSREEDRIDRFKKKARKTREILLRKKREKEARQKAEEEKKLEELKLAEEITASPKPGLNEGLDPQNSISQVIDDNESATKITTPRERRKEKKTQKNRRRVLKINPDISMTRRNAIPVQKSYWMMCIEQLLEPDNFDIEKVKIVGYYSKFSIRETVAPEENISYLSNLETRQYLSIHKIYSKFKLDIEREEKAYNFHPEKQEISLQWKQEMDKSRCYVD